MSIIMQITKVEKKDTIKFMRNRQARVKEKVQFDVGSEF